MRVLKPPPWTRPRRLLLSALLAGLVVVVLWGALAERRVSLGLLAVAAGCALLGRLVGGWLGHNLHDPDGQP